jgi:molybdopterin-guanine dinucleotide biosynthesis protein A
MPIETKNLTAVVLAGGKSIRMGTDKAALPHPVSKIPLLVRQLDLLTELGLARLLVSARAGQVLPPYPHDVGRVNDHGESGPLGGIVAALAAT